MKDSDGTMIERDIEDAPYTMIPNALLADTGISWKAKGMISYLLGKPAHWKARTKDIERHGSGGATEVLTAMRELRNVGYARLERHTHKGKVLKFVFRVANRRKYTMDDGQQVDVPQEVGEPQVGEPFVENPQMEESLVDAPVMENRHIRKKEGRKTELRKEEKIEKRSSSNKVRAFGDGAAPADSMPSAPAGADAPEPPSIGPRSKAEQFIQDYRAWGKAAHISATVVTEERTALQEFFTNNPEVSARELLALMLCAWLVPTDRKAEDSDYNPFWYCNEKSKRIASFIKYLPNIQEETRWSAKLTDKQYRLAEQRFIQQKAA